MGCRNNQGNIPRILNDEYISNLETMDICQLRNTILLENPIVKIRALYTGRDTEILHLTGIDSCKDFQVVLADGPYFYFVDCSDQKDEITKTNKLHLFRKLKNLPNDKLIVEVIGIYQSGGYYGHLNSYSEQIIPLEIKVIKLIQY